MDLELVIVIATILGTFATIFAAVIQYSSYKRRKKEVAREFKITENLKVYRTRNWAVLMDKELVKRAGTGDEIFGSCIECNFPPELITTGIRTAVEKGITFKFLLYSGPGGLAFGKLIVRSGVRNCEVRVFHEPKPIRLIGIKNKEIMIVLGEVFKPEEYYTIHIIDSTIAQFFYEVYQSLWGRSEDFDSYLKRIEPPTQKPMA